MYCAGHAVYYARHAMHYGKYAFAYKRPGYVLQKICPVLQAYTPCIKEAMLWMIVLIACKAVSLHRMIRRWLPDDPDNVWDEVTGGTLCRTAQFSN